MENRFYPLLFEPNLHPVVWGGDQIERWKGLPDSGRPIGESWEVSAVPSSLSIVANGAYRGKDLAAVIAAHPVEVLGRHVAAEYDNQLPLLVKFIDARRDLSIQVHPDDEMAAREHGKRGKTEMWYVIDAQPGAFLYDGFTLAMPQGSREEAAAEYKRRIADGTITEVLARHEVHAGDVFYLPAGRVHAICSGILLAEVQQSSDVTYRIFDYNRPGMDGKPRELHTELAARALNYQVEKEYCTAYDYREGCANVVVDCPFFNVRVADVQGELHRDLLAADSFVIAMCMRGNCRIRVRRTGEEVQLREGFSTLIPAATADYDLIADNKDGRSQVLEAYIDGSKHA